MNLLALGNIGPWEVIVIALVALLIFGKRLPEVARSAGKAVSSFKRGLRETEDEVEESEKALPTKKDSKSEDKSTEPKKKV